MSHAYVLLQVQIDDPEVFERYVEAAGPTIGAHGGEVLAADDRPQLIEGRWHGPRTIVLRFESKRAALGWYESDDYQLALKLRLAAANSNAVLVDGLP